MFVILRPFYLAIFFVLANLGVSSAFADTTADIGFVQAKLSTVDWGQYMARGCQSIAVNQWPGFPTVECHYDTGYGNVPVILLNPDNAQLAKWIVTACNDANISQTQECAERIAAQIKCQSGAQFPIAGFVDEGPLYLFRDGVTVSISGFDLGPCEGLKRKPTPQEEDLALRDGSVQTVCRYARLTGTTRPEFKVFATRLKPPLDVPSLDGLPWQKQIRDEYQSAWSSPRNRLISAWAVDNADSLNSKMSFEQFFENACPKKTRWSPWF